MVPGPSTPNYCSACGTKLGSDARFCPQCGSLIDRGERSSAESSTSTADYRWLRRRTRDYTSEGWDVHRDDGDRVILIRRRFGSLPVHVLLLIFTGGLGNLLYAWYCYSPGASRVELRADGTERWADGRESGGSIRWSRVAGISAGVVLLLAAVTSIASGSLVSVTVGILFLALFVLLIGRFLPFGPDFGPRRSVTTFGRKQTVDEDPVESGDVRCSQCGAPATGGVVRTFADRSYVAGFPVRTYEEGENEYCPTCAADNERFDTDLTDADVLREFA